MEAVAVAVEKKKPVRKIPEALVYEIMDGQPYYRKGYKSVLNRTKKMEDIMGSSTLQGEIHIYLLSLLVQHLDLEKFTIHCNEAGLHIDKGNNLAGDIFLYDRRAMTPENINKFYSSVPPLLAIEIDVRIDLEKESDLRYVNRKIRKLLDFGVEKVIWILTETKQVITAERNVPAGQFMDWDRDVEIRPGLTFNIGQYLEKRGIVVE
jgi:hypothetical protein